MTDKVYSYETNDRGEIVFTYFGAPKEGMFQSDVKIDTDKYFIIEGKLVAKNIIDADMIRKVAYVDKTFSNVFHIGECMASEIPSGEKYFALDVTDLVPQPKAGWAYSNGVFSEHTLSLDEIKEKYISILYLSYVKEKELVVKANGYGYDSDPESSLDFLLAKDRVRDKRDEWLALPAETRGEEPTEVFRVYVGAEKQTLPHTYSMFVEALRTGADSQRACLTKFYDLREQIQQCQNEEAIKKISWE